MTTKLKKADRQKIVDDFAERNGGRFDPRAFVDHVQRSNGQHPAWTWFTWDDAKAAGDHRIWQARRFVHDLVVLHSVETIYRGKVVVSQVESPAFISPMEGRIGGGGYLALDPDDPAQMVAFCSEAATSLQSWVRRYSAAVAYAGGSVSSLQKQLKALEKVAPVEASEAA